MKAKVCLLIPYFGKWPKFFNLYLNSCAYNAAFDVIFLTDLNLPDDVSDSVRKIHFSMSDIKSYFSYRLGEDVALHSFYKLCDLKPTYGYVFSDYIKDYDFWGFGDIDLIYGNTSKFLTQDLFDKYDLLTFRTDWLSGALTFFRNTQEVNLLFKKSSDWKKIITQAKHFSFTECARQYDQIRKGVSALELKADIESMTVVCKKAAVRGELRLFERKLVKENIDENEYLKYEKGIITDQAGKEYLLYHYITEKHKRAFYFPNWSVIPATFWITSNGFYTKRYFEMRGFIKILRELNGIAATLKKKLKAWKK